MLTTQSIFDRYEAVRDRLPVAASGPTTVDIGSLLDISGDADAFVFDAFGVLNVGETLIPGADTRLDQLRDRGCAIRILTNAASYDRSGAIAKFKRLGLRVEDSEIITSRDATLRGLAKGHWGVIAANEDPLTDIPHGFTRLGDRAEDFDRVDHFLFLSAANWTPERQEILVSAMQGRPRRLVIANADLAAPRGSDFSFEPGFFGHQVADLFPEQVQFFGKPFGDVYDLVEASLPLVETSRIVMCGDTLHTDVLGAAARGWRTVLVTRDGLFAGFDTEPFSRQSGLFADWRLGRI